MLNIQDFKNMDTPDMIWVESGTWNEHNFDRSKSWNTEIEAGFYVFDRESGMFTMIGSLRFFDPFDLVEMVWCNAKPVKT